VSYQLEIRREVYAQVKRLSGHVRQRIRRLINSLPDDPRPPGAKQLRDHTDTWRYRIDRWRIVWRIYDDILLVIVISPQD
jgi:mRNA interferase RelE/StbE